MTKEKAYLFNSFFFTNFLFSKLTSIFKSVDRDMSGTRHFMHVFPACPLEIQSALPNRVLVGELCTALAPAPVRALLRFDFALRLESAGEPERVRGLVLC